MAVNGPDVYRLADSIGEMDVSLNPRIAGRFCYVEVMLTLLESSALPAEGDVPIGRSA